MSEQLFPKKLTLETTLLIEAYEVKMPQSHVDIVCPEIEHIRGRPPKNGNIQGLRIAEQE